MADSSATTTTRGRHRRHGGRGLLLVWASGLVAATVLGLGVSGTLSSWTSAVVTNSNNFATTANAVILKETSGAATCQSSQNDTNSYSCTTINKYSGTAISPGGTQSVTVTMANVGTTSGTLTLQAGSCTSSGGVTTGSTDACGQMQVKVECPSGTAKYPATGTSTLTQFASASATTIATLAKDATVSCVFTVTLPSGINPSYAGQTLTQPLTWTLS